MGCGYVVDPKPFRRWLRSPACVTGTRTINTHPTWAPFTLAHVLIHADTTVVTLGFLVSSHHGAFHHQRFLAWGAWQTYLGCLPNPKKKKEKKKSTYLHKL